MIVLRFRVEFCSASKFVVIVTLFEEGSGVTGWLQYSEWHVHIR